MYTMVRTQPQNYRYVTNCYTCNYNYAHIIMKFQFLFGERLSRIGKIQVDTLVLEFPTKKHCPDFLPIALQVFRQNVSPNSHLEGNSARKLPKSIGFSLHLKCKFLYYYFSLLCKFSNNILPTFIFIITSSTTLSKNFATQRTSKINTY